MSKKYVIEIKPEYEDSFQGVMLLGVKDSTLYVDTVLIEDLEELNSDYINEHFGELQDEAYQRGFEEGRKVGIKDGMCEAWDAARKIVVDTDNGGIALGTLGEIFGTQAYSCIMRDNTAQEAIAKLKAYEDKQKDDDSIKRGDEVVEIQSGARFCVTNFWENNHGEKGVSGFNHECPAFQATFDKVKKTGKHYEIQSILEAMKQE